MKEPIMAGNNSFRIILAALLLLGLAAQESRTEVELRPYDFSYEKYTRLLSDNVTKEGVNYSRIKSQRAVLDSLVLELGTADLSSASKDQTLAFYCNAYNILTIRSIVDAYPVATIKDIDGVWDKKRWLVAGQEITLDELEHEILRKKFSEPRIHMAINCASRGCPPLLEVPYYHDRLDSLLNVSSRRFAISVDHNSFDWNKRVARLSAIFDWFGNDFVNRYYESGKFPKLDKKKGATLNFVVLHLPEEMAAKVSSSDYAVEYIEFDWTLNDLSL